MTDEATTTVGHPFFWRLSLASPPERVFELLDTDAGRERFWALHSHAVPRGFDLVFPGGLQGRVEVLGRDKPRHLSIRYFGSEADFELTEREDGGCLFEVRCRCDDPAEWLEFFPGWVSWLLTLKAAADFDVDLRNNEPRRTWAERYVDP
jgi:uncharacterized protein YndB with AHSA1/START domain